MKWIFAFNQDSNADYDNFVRVAVFSARQNTSLEAVCLYDGEPSAMTRWLEAMGVEIVPCRSRFAGELLEIARKRDAMGIYRIGAGAFLRLELPRIARERAWKDEFVLYTDCDVLFVRDPQAVLESLRPKVFAAAPEIHRQWPLHMNTGVLWIHLAAWCADEEPLTAFTRHHLERLLNDSYDQGALRAFYNPPHRLAYRLRIPPRWIYFVLTRWPRRTFRWDTLADEFNWKPYWGAGEDAFIVHFHGPKPQNHLGEGDPGLPQNLIDLQNATWKMWCDRWKTTRDEVLHEIKASDAR